MSADPSRVFLSGATGDFGNVRLQLRAAMARGGCHVIHQADFPQTQTDTVLKLAHLIEPCGVLIHLIGRNPGSPATKEAVSEYLAHSERDSAFLSAHPKLRAALGDFSGITYTQWEVLIGLYLGIPIFVYADASHRDASHPQRSHLNRLLLSVVPRCAETFEDEKDLYLKVMADLMAYYRTRLTAAQFSNVFRPTNLPYHTLGTLFKGREEFLQKLHKQLDTKSAAIIQGRQAIHGMGGVGKTRAAIEYAWRHGEKYSALLFVAADTPEDLRRNIASLCGTLVLNLPEREVTDQNVQYAAAIHWLQQHPGWFLIIDNVDSKAAAAAVEALLPELSSGHVVITSRIADWSAQVTPLDLDVLEEEAAASFLLERTAGRRIPTAEDAADAHTLARLLDCLALALEQAAAYIREQRLTIRAYIERWQSVPAEAIVWHDAVKMQYPRSLAITYETSVEQLSPGAQELFRILAWVAPAPVPLTALEKLSLSGEPRPLLMELENLHLVRFREDGQSFTVHRLVQEITRQKQADPRPSPALIVTLEWISGLFVGDGTDVRTWLALNPLVSHAQSVASFADGQGLSEPTAHLMHQVAVLFNAKAQHYAAEPLMRRVLAIDEARYGKDHPEVAIDLNNLAQLLKTTNRLAEAEPLMCRVLAIDEANYGKNHPTVAIDLNNLAGLLQTFHRLTEAEPLMRRALTIDEANYDKNHPRVATDLNNLAHLLKETNRLAEAEPLMRRALAIDEANYGKNHPTVAIVLSNLAALLQATNRLTEAEPLKRRALAIDEASYGKDHPQVAIDLNNLAQLLKATHRLDEAEPLMQRALAIDEATYGKSHPNVAIDLHNLAALLRATQRMDEAELLVRRALAIYEASYDKDHPMVAMVLSNLAALLRTTHRLDEAEPLMRRALTIDETSYGKDHPIVAIRLNNLAHLLQETHRPTEAEPLMRRMAIIFLRSAQQTGHAHLFLYDALQNYANLLQKWKGDEFVKPNILSLGAEAGMPEDRFREILKQAFG